LDALLGVARGEDGRGELSVQTARPTTGTKLSSVRPCSRMIWSKTATIWASLHPRCSRSVLRKLTVEPVIQAKAL
jgi:hypothetical protein